MIGRCEADLVRSALSYKQTASAVASRGSGGVYAELRNAARHHTPRQHTPEQTLPKTETKTPRPCSSKVSSPRQRQREQSRADRAAAEQERWRRVTSCCAQRCSAKRFTSYATYVMVWRSRCLVSTEGGSSNQKVVKELQMNDAKDPRPQGQTEGITRIGLCQIEETG